MIGYSSNVIVMVMKRCALASLWSAWQQRFHQKFHRREREGSRCLLDPDVDYQLNIKIILDENNGMRPSHFFTDGWQSSGLMVVLPKRITESAGDPKDIITNVLSFMKNFHFRIILFTESRIKIYPEVKLF